MLSTQQVKYIAQAVGDEGITRRLLYDDLVDHLCCSTETAMRKAILSSRLFPKP